MQPLALDLTFLLPPAWFQGTFKPLIPLTRKLSRGSSAISKAPFTMDSSSTPMGNHCSHLRDTAMLTGPETPLTGNQLLVTFSHSKGPQSHGCQRSKIQLLSLQLRLSTLPPLMLPRKPSGSGGCFMTLAILKRVPPSFMKTIRAALPYPRTPS